MLRYILIMNLYNLALYVVICTIVALLGLPWTGAAAALFIFDMYVRALGLVGVWTRARLAGMTFIAMYRSDIAQRR